MTLRVAFAMAGCRLPILRQVRRSASRAESFFARISRAISMALMTHTEEPQGALAWASQMLAYARKSVERAWL